MQISKKVKNCRICSNKKLYKYLDLGNQPPSNSFVKKKNIKEKTFSLTVVLCKSCGLSQLDTVVSHKFIFSDYAYLSSTSKALVRHYNEMINNSCERFKLNKKDLILDIGCNDGIILDCYKKKYQNLLGIEPSSAGKIAKKKGYKIYKNFFNSKLSKKILSKNGYAKLITTTNVFAHIDNIKDFTNGISKILDQKKGVFIIEFPYLLDMLKHLYFDTIYHEHLSYLSITPLKRLFDKYNLKIFDVRSSKVGASGPAVRVYVCHKNAEFNIYKSVGIYLHAEKKFGIKKISPYKKFATNVRKIKLKLLKLIKNLKKKKFKIGAYGAPAKGNTLLNFLKLNDQTISAVAENNKIKIGCYTPGSKIKIIDDENFIKLNYKYALLLSWNYLDFFIKKSRYYKKANGKFIVPFPKPRII